jgi:hypothetical protein
MNHVLLQIGPTPLTAPQLAEAFRGVKRLTAVDAEKIARQAYGILVRGLSLEELTTVQCSLAGQGVTTEVVPESDIPPLPEPKYTRRLELKDEALTVYDAIGRPVPVPWAHVALIAAGIVPRVNIVSFTTEEVEISLDLDGWTRRDVVTRLNHKLDTNAQLVLDVVLTAGRMRFQVESREFLWKYAVDRPDLDAHQRLAELVRLLMARGPHALLNRGAAQLKNGAPLPQLYSSKAVFADESAWMLWCASRPPAAAAPAA